MAQDEVQEEAHGEAGAPVGDDHEERGDFRVFVAAKDALDGGGDVVEELPAGAVDEERFRQSQHGGVIGIDGGDGVAAEVGEGNGTRRAGEGGEEAEAGKFAGPLQPPGAHFDAHQDGHGHGAAHGEHVDEAGEIQRRLVRRDDFGAEFGDENDDEAEEAGFHENADAIGDAESHVFLPGGEMAGGGRKDFLPHESLLRQHHEEEEEQQEEIGEERRDAGADAAHGGGAQLTENEGVIQKSIDGERQQEEPHGNRSAAHRVRQRAERQEQRFEENAAHHGEHVVAGDVLYLRRQGKPRQDGVDGEEIAEGDDGGEHEGEVHAASHHFGNGGAISFPQKLCRHRRAGGQYPHGGGEHRQEEARPDGHPRQIISAHVAAHGRIHEIHPHRRNLRDEDRDHGPD